MCNYFSTYVHTTSVTNLTTSTIISINKSFETYGCHSPSSAVVVQYRLKHADMFPDTRCITDVRLNEGISRVVLFNASTVVSLVASKIYLRACLANGMLSSSLFGMIVENRARVFVFLCEKLGRGGGGSVPLRERSSFCVVLLLCTLVYLLDHPDDHRHPNARRGVETEGASAGVLLEQLMDLLDRPLYTMSGPDLEELLQLIEVLVAPLEDLKLDEKVTCK